MKAKAQVRYLRCKYSWLSDSHVTHEHFPVIKRCPKLRLSELGERADDRGRLGTMQQRRMRWTVEIYRITMCD
jgi:hypothetical protein